MNDYDVVSDSSLAGLVERVKAYVRDGWEAAGGVSVYQEHSLSVHGDPECATIFCQAVAFVRPDELVMSVAAPRNIEDLLETL